MKKTLLSALAALTLSSLSASASSDVKFYQDANGQVFTKPAEGRKLIDIPKKETSWHSHADKLKFSSLAYLGYTYNDYKSDTPTMNYQANKSNFEIRRGYSQVKAYLLDDPKSYYRITLDVHQNAADDLVVRAEKIKFEINAEDQGEISEIITKIKIAKRKKDFESLKDLCNQLMDVLYYFE